MVGVGVVLAVGLTYVATRSAQTPQTPQTPPSDASAVPSSPARPVGPDFDAGGPSTDATVVADNPSGPQDSPASTGDHPYDPNTILDLGPSNNGVAPLPDVPNASWRTYPPAGTPEREFLAPVGPGLRIADAQVVFVSAVDSGVIRVVLMRGAEEIHLAVALAGSPDRPAPARVGRYAVYIYDTTSPSPEASFLAQALANLLSPHANMTPPPGMTEASTEAPRPPGAMNPGAPAARPLPPTP